jgi:Asp-tRNA(Asn)/Glu-tRNA(Gln) amidotransferase A subunit family amidase
MTEEPGFLPATRLAREIRTGDRSAVDLLESYLDRIERRNSITNAYVRVLDEEARESARLADRAVAAGEDLGPLHGVPVAIKDNTDVAGVPTTFGVKPLANNMPERSAVPVKRLEAAGAIVFGKTNTPEFGHRSTTDNPLFGSTGTPFDPTKTAGGSSGGSAAAVADGLVPLAQGTDGGGSLRIPASACGAYGHKPSAGFVATRNRPSGFGHTPFVETGPLARTVADAAAALEVMAGPHPGDPFCHPERDLDLRGAVERPIDDLRVAWSPDLGVFPVAESVREIVADAIRALADAGAIVERADPDFEHSREELREAWAVGFEVSIGETRANIRESTDLDLLDQREDLTPLVTALIDRANEYSAIEYKRADVIRTTAFDAVQALFGEYDLLVSPTLAVLPFGRDSLGPDRVAGESVHPVFGWCLTWLFNMTGHPAASVPAGFVDGLPIGMQVIGPRFRDDVVLAAGAAVERERPWRDRYPPQA